MPSPISPVTTPKIGKAQSSNSIQAKPCLAARRSIAFVSEGHEGRRRLSRLRTMKSRTSWTTHSPGEIMLRSALALAEKGLHVFPCQPRDKRPATTNGVKAATTDPDTIRQWWQRDPQLNIGIATGKPSGVFVLDVDGIDAEAELRKL